MKIEQDRVEVLSGVRHGLTLGSPVAIMIENKDWQNWTEVMSVAALDVEPEKSRRLKRPRPGHADWPAVEIDARDCATYLNVRLSARHGEGC